MSHLDISDGNKDHAFRPKPHPFQPAHAVDENGVEHDANGSLQENTDAIHKTSAQDDKDGNELDCQDKTPCPTCLGLLQIDMDKLAAHLYDQFKNQEYKLDSPTFSLSIRLPFQLAIRHTGMIHHLHECFHSDPLYSQIQPIEVKEVFKSNLKSSFSKISGMTFNGKSPFAVSLHFQHTDSENDYEFLQALPHAKFTVKKSRKRGKTFYQGASAEKINRALQLVQKSDFMAAKQSPPPAIHSFVTLCNESTSSLFEHSSVYIAGRYCKLKRHISNSAWVVAGKRMTEDSIEELIGDFLPEIFKNEAKGYKFSSAGREDSDVLMLNDGRPFYFQIIHPKIASVGPDQLKMLEEKINSCVDGKIRVFDLQMVSLEDTSVLKNSAATKSKSYMCLVELEKPVSLDVIKTLSGQKNLLLAQRNPTRVPRRADMVREKTIEEIIIHPQDKTDQGLYKRLLVDLKTSAGTYVKEFMHGDDGRTTPSLSSILDCGVVRVVSLDVSRVHLEWPPRISSTPFIHNEIQNENVQQHDPNVDPEQDDLVAHVAVVEDQAQK